MNQSMMNPPRTDRVKKTYRKKTVKQCNIAIDLPTSASAASLTPPPVVHETAPKAKKRKLQQALLPLEYVDNNVKAMDIDIGSAYSSEGRKENEVHLHVELKRSEAYYQRMLEVILGGGHKMLDSGTTDITTASFHAEIKKWSAWKHAVGQLLCYNADDPKDSKRMYLFGLRCNEASVIKCTHALGIELYAVDDVVGGISVTRLPDETTQIFKLKLM